jgi:D-sedoheptulose 7-phosphate isomerase
MAMDDYWQRYHGAIASALNGLATTAANNQALDPEAAFARLCEWTQEVRAADGTIHFAGNGASACFSSHMAVDFTKNAGVRAFAYNDVASLTAIANDFSYERVFSDPIKWYARKGDLLATISSSGNSPNIVRAIAAAREKGLRVVTFSGMKPDNKSRAAGDLNFYISAWSYGIVECSHQVLLHAWLDRFMDVREGQMTKPQFT